MLAKGLESSLSGEIRIVTQCEIQGHDWVMSHPVYDGKATTCEFRRRVCTRCGLITYAIGSGNNINTYRSVNWQDMLEELAG
jgi:hypothetical protein